MVKVEFTSLRSASPIHQTPGGDALQNYWIYIIGLIIGAAIGAFAYEAVRLEPEQAKGAPDDLMPT